MTPGNLCTRKVDYQKYNGTLRNTRCTRPRTFFGADRFDFWVAIERWYIRCWDRLQSVYKTLTKLHFHRLWSELGYTLYWCSCFGYGKLLTWFQKCSRETSMGQLISSQEESHHVIDVKMTAGTWLFVCRYINFLFFLWERSVSLLPCQNQAGTRVGQSGDFVTVVCTERSIMEAACQKTITWRTRGGVLQKRKLQCSRSTVTKDDGAAYPWDTRTVLQTCTRHLIMQSA